MLSKPMRTRMATVVTAMTLVTGASGVSSAIWPAAQGTTTRPTYHLLVTTVPVIPLNPLLSDICPNGDPPVTLTNMFCQEPLEVTCTAYWCTDPVTQQQFLLQRRLGLPNPECHYAAMQTEPCTNDITIPEKFLPSRKQLVETMPMLYPKDYLAVPLLPPDK